MTKILIVTNSLNHLNAQETIHNEELEAPTLTVNMLEAFVRILVLHQPIDLDIEYKLKRFSKKRIKWIVFNAKDASLTEFAKRMARFDSSEYKVLIDAPHK